MAKLNAQLMDTFNMAAGGFFARQNGARAHCKLYLWFQRNELGLLAIDAACIALLLVMHLLTSTTSEVFTQEAANAIQISAIVLVSFIALSVVWKGLVPIVICFLGIVLMHNSVILPYYLEPETNGASFAGTEVLMPDRSQAVIMATDMHFMLGLSMVALSIIIAYRPSLLFTRNRPEPLDTEWSKYPVWHDNTLLADGRSDRSVPVKSLMTDQDRYLLWRYEYVLADIYGTPHLVRPDGLVPRDSVIFRDKESGRVMGKDRYPGYFA